MDNVTDHHDGFALGTARDTSAAAPGWGPPRAWLRLGLLQKRARSVSFLACVVLPALAASLYEYGMAADQYVSSCKFIVRAQAPQMAAPGSLTSELAGGNPMLALIEDSEVVVQYIGSGQILADLRPGLKLTQIYATPRADWLARMGASLPPERQLPYWRRMVQPSFDLSSGIITVQVRAFTPRDAALVAQAVLARAQALVDEMSAAARDNALDYATATAAAAQAQLLRDETALAAYRNRYAVLFPELSAAQNSTVGGDVRLSLAQDQASLAALRAQGQDDDSPQVQTLTARIAAEQGQAQALAAELAANTGGQTLPLATVVSGYDTLMETQTLDQQLYASDLLALQNARAMAAERSLYLESFVQPAVPNSAIYPVRWLVTVETALAGFIAWILLMLVANIVRDQLD